MAPFIVVCNGALIHISKGNTMTFRVFFTTEEATEPIDKLIYTNLNALEDMIRRERMFKLKVRIKP